VQAGIHLVETPADVGTLQVRDERNLAYVTQTTLSVDDATDVIAALRCRFPGIVGPKKDDICYATQNRQDAVKALARESDVVIVVGSPNSSNSNRLREVAQNMGVAAYMVDTAADLDPRWLAGASRVDVSNWAVSDDATRALMVAFYTKMLAAGLAPGEALRAAKLELLRSGGAFAHPAHWAAFVLWGG